MLSKATFDSRAVKPGMTFVALKGEKADGRDFIPQALAAGAARIIEGYEAFDAAAREKRRSLKAKVIGVTGSAGKTTTKELLKAFLSCAGRTCATEGNFNNHIGLPLTILNCPDDAEFLVLEMGTNHPGEIAHLCSIAEPDSGLLTNVGTAHLEFFLTREGIAREKGVLLGAVKDFGVASATCYALSELPKEKLVLCDVAKMPAILKEAVSGILPGEHNLSNAALAFEVARRYGVTAEEAAGAMRGFTLPGARWRVSSAAGVTFVDDTYNANPDSMIAALDAFKSFGEAKRRIAILGDMFELGDDAAIFHARVFDHAYALGLDMVIAVGAQSSACRHDRAFETAECLAAALPGILQEGDFVLLKASHAMHLDAALEAFAK